MTLKYSLVGIGLLLFLQGSGHAMAPTVVDGATSPSAPHSAVSVFDCDRVAAAVASNFDDDLADLARYAAREQCDPARADFRGGDGAGAAVTIVAIVAIVVLLLIIL